MADPVRFQHFEVQRREDGSLHELGRGAMGVTYKAFDTNLRCFVALKVINAAYLGDDVARQRFLREARAAAALRHPNVATVFHLGEEGGDWFYAMEYVDGETVEALMKREGAVPAATALQIALQVARALGAAEKQGLVHRDIKPSNLMVIREDEFDLTVKVIDFGLAKNSAGTGETSALTLGGFLGTPHFASPEQLEEREIDVRSDIYSLGVTLYYMLAGRVPFSGSLAQVMSQHLHRQPPLEALLGLPKPLLGLLRKMLETDPAARQQTPAELRREIEACMASLRETVPAAPVPVADESFETQALDAGTTTIAPPSALPPAPAPTAPAKASVPTLPSVLPEVPHNSRGPALMWVAGLLLLVALAVAGGGYALIKFRSVKSDLAPLARPVPTPVPVAVSSPSPAATPAPTAAPLVSATPSATPVPTATPDPVAASLHAAVEQFETDPASAISSLVVILKANPGNPDARTTLEQCLASLVQRQLTPGQTAALREPLEFAAGKDFADAQLLLGRQLRETDPSASLKWLLAAANNGSTAAMVKAGLALSNKHGDTAPDLPGAAVWFQRAAEKGDPAGMFLLAQCHLGSTGVTRDPRKAVELLQAAVDKNDPSSMNQLGDLYEKGIPGVLEVDSKEAFRLFAQARDLGFDDALANLGALYINGEGVQKNVQAGVDLFREGVSKGNGNCMFNYARCLEKGLPGVAVDKAAARLMYAQAAQAGNVPAQRWCRDNHVGFGPAPAPGAPVPAEAPGRP